MHSALDYDIVVVGAGPAGSIAAYETARAGHNTLLLEKFNLPREKPCGGAVMYRGLQIIHGEIPFNLIERPIYGMRFVLPSGDEPEFVSEKLIGITVCRSKFDEYLARRAEAAGAELLEGARVVDVSTSADYARVKTQDDQEFTSKIIVGADGVNSVVSRALGLRPERKDPYKVGLGMESDFYVGADGVMKAMNGNPGILEIIPVDGRVSYGWVFPKREHLAIGIAGSSVHMHPLRPQFESFLKQMETRLGLSLKPERRRTYFLGGDGLGSQNVVSRALLIGDAAGFVDPLMGEGIAYAMRSGQFAAHVIDRCLKENRFDEKILMNYQRLCNDEFASNFALAAWAGIKGTSLAASMLPRVSGHKLASDIMAGLARGELGYSDIPATIFRKLPRELPNIIRRVVQARMINGS
ncbi:MAG: NAD(P)/FAD-dependent oxidoreductase [Candidatus Thorarchaeota archaeon]